MTQVFINCACISDPCLPVFISLALGLPCRPMEEEVRLYESIKLHFSAGFNAGIEGMTIEGRDSTLPALLALLCGKSLEVFISPTTIHMHSDGAVCTGCTL